MMSTTSFKRSFALLWIAVALTSCTTENPSYCDANVACGDPSRPFCDESGVYRASEGFTNTCIPEPRCHSGKCGSDAPVCEPEAEVCVGCREDADCARFADAGNCTADGTCIGCEVNADCGSDACDPATHQCASEDEVIYVDRSSVTAGGECTRLAPCGDLRQAVDQISSERFIMRIAAGGYPSGVNLPPGRLVILADANAILTPGDTSEMMRIEAGADILIHGLSLRGVNGPDGMRAIACEGGAGEPPTHVQLTSVRVSGAPGDGIHMNGCAVDIVASLIFENAGFGLSASLGRLDVIRSRVSKNLDGAILANGTTLVFRNNFVARNGRPPQKKSPSGFAAGLLYDVADGSRFEHNTLARNHGSLQCLNRFTISNNIFANTTEEEGVGCQHRFSLVGSTPPEGPGNLRATPIFVDPESEDDLHLDPRSPGLDQGESSDVSDDIDGQTRPAGAAPDIGADEVGPG